ncbi:MAG: hypothetical protein ACR2OU_01805 [Thermomicrobiales bacterium]
MRTKTPYIFPIDKIIRYLDHNPADGLEVACQVVGVAMNTVNKYRKDSPEVNTRINDALMRRRENGGI